MSVRGLWLVLEPIFCADSDSATVQMRAFRYVLVSAAIRFGH